MAVNSHYINRFPEILKKIPLMCQNRSFHQLGQIKREYLKPLQHTNRSC